MKQASSTAGVIEFEGITKRYQRVEALSDVSVAIPAGLTGLIGLNGAGKTTLIKILLGLIRATSGSVRVLGEECGSWSAAYRDAIGYVPEDDCFLSGLSGVESVLFAARMAGLPRTEGLRRSHEILDFCGVQQERYRLVETYSTGMRQKVKFAQAIVHDPPLLILDEPTSGLDPEERQGMLNRVTTLARKFGKSVLMSTHILPDIEQVCDHVVLIHRGRVRAEGELSVLLSRSSGSWWLELDRITAAFREAVSERGGKLSAIHGDRWLLQGGVGGVRELYRLARETDAVLRSVRSTRRSLEEFFVETVSHIDQCEGIA